MNEDLRPWRYAVLGLWICAVDAWFAGPLVGRWAGHWAAVPFLIALAVVAARRFQRRAKPTPGPDDRRFVIAAAAIALVATLVRLPALAAPASLISSDSAVAGIIAQELAAGQLPAPIYAPGFPYEGTLKPHVTVLLSWLMPGGIPSAYAWSSHLFHLAWTIAVMALARRAGGVRAALAAGLFMAISPRFLVAFSLNNVGQYPEVNALGALALVALATFGAPMASAFLLGLAVWQQLLGVYFVATTALLLVVTPDWRRARPLIDAALGFIAGSYPLWVWNAANGWATFDLFRRGSKQPYDRLAGLPDAATRTLTISFPKMFGLTDLGVPATAALLLGALLPVLVIVMAVASRREIGERRGRSSALVATALLLVVVSLFAASKFSHRGAQRPRYLMPVYTSVAIAFGWGIARIAGRSRTAAAAIAVTVLGANLAGLVPWLQGRRDAEARDRAILAELERLNVRTGYAGFWVAPKYTFLSEGRVVLSGELGPIVSWVHPAHAARVREAGPDALIVGSGATAEALERRLRILGREAQRTDVGGLVVFHRLGRPLALEDVEGYDVAQPAGEEGENPDVDP